MYKAIKYFVDLQDNRHSYNAGDTFPRDGLEVSRDRIVELSTAINKRNEPLITFIQDEVEQVPIIPEEADDLQNQEETDSELEEPIVDLDEQENLEKPKKTSSRRSSK